MTDLEDRLVASLSRTITRSRFLQRGMRAAVAFGTASTAALFGARVALAGSLRRRSSLDLGLHLLLHRDMSWISQRLRTELQTPV